MKNNFKICRENKNMTAKEVGKKIGVSKQTIYCMENGTNNPSVDRLFIRIDKVWKF